jgi:hypothetical protein
VCPTSTESVELLLYLAEPCHVSQLLLTIAHGADDITSPGSLEIRTGPTLGELKLVLEVRMFQPPFSIIRFISFLKRVLTLPSAIES